MPRNTGELLSDELQEGKQRVSPYPPQPLAGEEEGTVSATSTQPQLPHPIEMIPLEIFQMIMREVVTEPLWSVGSPNYYDLTRLRLVCRRWTQVLEGMPEVWARISLRMDERLIDLALSRSMHSPLSIDLKGQGLSPSALDKLLQHIDRWKYLVINYAGDSTLDQVAVQSFPILEELMLFDLYRHRSNISFSGSAPMLRTVVIDSFRIQWSSSILSNLRELVLRNIGGGAPDIDTFLKLLANSPKLTLLSVWYTPLTPSPSPSPSHHTHISLSCLRFLAIEYVGQGILKQLVEFIDIPRSTTCQFAISWDNDDIISLFEQLEPIHRRHSTLAEVSKGSRSTLILGGGLRGPNIRTMYEGEAHQLGTLTVEVESLPECNADVFEYFARQLVQSGPNPVPPVLHIIGPTDRATFDNQLELFSRLRDHLPNTDNILFEDLDPECIQGVFDTLFPPKHSSRPFPRLSTLTFRGGTHEEWAYRLQKRQKRGLLGRDVDPLPLNTLRIEGGNISAEKVQRLKVLVPNLVLDRVQVN
ncbi:hypothetical protein FS837_003755 [Tulasnella sp. UAMH 9824]|nr:hypothetical protein FS837_003755 [Tulasnella sp. UAMH 9824]